MSTKVGDIFVRANLDRSEYDKGLVSLQKTSAKTAKLIGGVMKATIGAAGVAALAKLTSTFVKEGAKLEQAYGGIETMFKGASDRMVKYAYQAYKTAGISANQYMEQVTSFSAALLQSLGQDTEKAASVANQAIIDMSDNANKFGTSMEAIQNAYQGFAKQNFTMLDNLKLGYGGTRTEMERLLADAQELTGRAFNINSLADIYQAIHAIQVEMGVAGTTAREAMSTWAGAVNMVRASWSNFTASVGQGLINLAQPILQVFARIADALTALGMRFLAWTEKITGKVGGIGKALSSAFGKKPTSDIKNAGSAIGGVGNGLKGAGGNAKKAKKEVQALKRELLGFDQITKLTKQDSATGTGGAGGIGGGGLDYGGIADETSNFVETVNGYFEGIKIPPALEKAIKGLGDAFSMLWDRLKSAGEFCYKNILVPIGKWFAETWLPKAIDTVSAGIRVFCAAWNLLLAVLKPLWAPLLKPCLEGLGKLLGKTLTSPMDLVTTSLNLLTAGLKLATEWVEKFYKWAGSLKINLKDEFTSTWNNIKSKWDEKITTVKTLAVNISDGVTSAWENLKSWWNSQTLATKTLTTNLADNVRSKFEDLKKWWNNQKVGAKTFATAFSDKVKSAWNTLIKWWNKLKGGTKTFTVNFKFADKLKSAWNGLVGKIKAARKKSSVVKALLPDIPYLAQGGYLPANTPRLAVVGDNKREGEIVAPESKLQAMADAAANRNSDEIVKLLTALLKTVSAIDTNVYLDGEQIKNNVVTRINNHTRATGQLEIIM